MSRLREHPPLPEEVERLLARARRLEWWTLIWLASIVVVMYFAMGSSEAMQAAWIEDLLSLAPPILFLIALKFERRLPSERFPFGLHRLGTLCFMVAALALAAMGGFLIVDAALVLLQAEHPTIGSVRIWDTEIWLGWLMVAALLYSVVPPVILGRMKRKIAPKIHDRVLHTDAEMNAADWKTGLAGLAGIGGIALGFWWADAAAAGLIGLDILRDGLKAMRNSVTELLDGAPRRLDSAELSPDVGRLERGLDAEGRARVRTTGRYLRVTVVHGDREAIPDPALAQRLLGDDHWRLVGLSRADVPCGPDETPDGGAEDAAAGYLDAAEKSS